MQKTSNFRLASLLVVLIILLPGCGSSTKIITSAAPTQSIIVDGKIDDWEGGIRKVEKESFSLGVQNDDEFLYLTLITIDATVSGQVIRNGLDIWFDPAGGREKVFGIRFPLGLVKAGRGRAARTQDRRGSGAEAMQRALEETFAGSLAELQILNDGEDGVVLPSDGIPGVKVSATYSLGTLTYELQIPLRVSDTYRYAIDSSPGSTIGFGLETPKLSADDLNVDPDDQTRRDGRSAGGVGDGFGGAGGIGGGLAGRGGPDARRGRGFIQADQVKFWASLALR